jgi:DmsE family decaheme c-type cytochrome
MYGCASLNLSKPIIPVSEYEKLIAGRLDADYVGDHTCLARCHAHDQIKQYFDASTMGAQLSADSGLPLVNCESCHGPGSLAVQNIKDVDGVMTCGFDTFIDLKDLPKQAQSLICLKCHSGNATFNLHNWNAGTHNMAGVSCFDCHDVHASANLKVHPKVVSDLCYTCHQDIRAQFMLPTHHAVPEQRVSCLDCHEPHGTTTEALMKEQTVKELCTNCHAEKEGPFVYEHADLTEDCRNCHVPHGSINNGLLTVKEPFLCKQCHAEHPMRQSNQAATKLDRFTRCTDCHGEIHGSEKRNSFTR